MKNNQKNSRNIEWVRHNNLCHGCGACYTICPYNAITIENSGELNYPVVDSEKCSDCNLCNKVCSGYQINYSLKSHLFLENCNNIYLISSKNTKINRMGASGGFITEFLIQLLESEKIDGVITASGDNIFNMDATIINTKQEIINVASSKYFPISMCKALKFMDPNKKYAFVGKGCDMASLALLQKYGKFNNIYIKIGIMCHHTPYAKATKKLISDFGMNSDNAKIIYRHGGWPGKTIIVENNKDVKIDYKVSWGKYLGIRENVPYRCIMCVNSFCEDADIVVGDPWMINPNLENRELGYSLVIAHTKKGISELKNLNSTFFDIKKSNLELLINSQKNLINKWITAHYVLLVLGLLDNKFKTISQLNITQLVNRLCKINKILKIKYGKTIIYLLKGLKYYLTK